jgi:hypothetical protein
LSDNPIKVIKIALEGTVCPEGVLGLVDSLLKRLSGQRTSFSIEGLDNGGFAFVDRDGALE